MLLNLGFENEFDLVNLGKATMLTASHALAQQEHQVFRQQQQVNKQEHQPNLIVVPIWMALNTIFCCLCL